MNCEREYSRFRREGRSRAHTALMRRARTDRLEALLFVPAVPLA